jgi:hypothetical protein
MGRPAACVSFSDSYRGDHRWRVVPVWTWFRLRLIFARVASTDATCVPFDFSQSGIERDMRPVLDAGHGFHRMALGMDHELIGVALYDASHRAAKQVRKVPDRALRCACDDHIHTETVNFFTGR